MNKSASALRAAFLSVWDSASIQGARVHLGKATSSTVSDAAVAETKCQWQLRPFSQIVFSLGGVQRVGMAGYPSWDYSKLQLQHFSQWSKVRPRMPKISPAAQRSFERQQHDIQRTVVQNIERHGIMGIVLANSLVYLMWQDHGSRGWMMQHFTTSYHSVWNQGRWYTLLTSCFSHFDFWHLGLNMFTFYSFGSALAARFGGSFVVRLYLMGGLVSALVALQMESYKKGGNPLLLRQSPALIGASGAVNSVATLSVALNPNTVLYLYGILPVPAMIFGLVYITYTSYKAFDPNDRSQVSHAGHLGGVILGLVTAYALRVGRLF